MQQTQDEVLGRRLRRYLKDKRQRRQWKYVKAHDEIDGAIDDALADLLGPDSSEATNRDSLNIEPVASNVHDAATPSRQQHRPVGARPLAVVGQPGEGSKIITLPAPEEDGSRRDGHDTSPQAIMAGLIGVALLAVALLGAAVFLGYIP